MKIVYVRCLETNAPFGCVVESLGSYGYSVCHPGQRFTKDRAREIALGRLHRGYRVEAYEVNPANTARELYTKEEVLKRVPLEVRPAFEHVINSIEARYEGQEQVCGHILMPQVESDECIGGSGGEAGTIAPVMSVGQRVKSWFFGTY